MSSQQASPHTKVNMNSTPQKRNKSKGSLYHTVLVSRLIMLQHYLSRAEPDWSRILTAANEVLGLDAECIQCSKVHDQIVNLTSAAEDLRLDIERFSMMEVVSKEDLTHIQSRLEIIDRLYIQENASKQCDRVSHKLNALAKTFEL